MRENSIAWRTYEILKDRIISGYYPHSYAFVEETLVKELGVSRTPIRSALKQLEEDGLVSIFPGKGAILHSVGIDEIENIFTIREALEGISARNAALVISEANIQTMKNVLAVSEEWLDKGDISMFAETGREIHKIILQTTKNPDLISIVNSIGSRVQRYQTDSYILPGRCSQSLQEHKDIVLAVSSRNPELAETYMRLHVRHAKETMILAFRNEI